MQTFSGVAGGSFPAPDHDYPSYLELRLTATDAGGLTDTRSVLLQPNGVVLSFASDPTGLDTRRRQRQRQRALRAHGHRRLASVGDGAGAPARRPHELPRSRAGPTASVRATTSSRRRRPRRSPRPSRPIAAAPSAATARSCKAASNAISAPPTARPACSAPPTARTIARSSAAARRAARSCATAGDCPRPRDAAATRSSMPLLKRATTATVSPGTAARRAVRASRRRAARPETCPALGPHLVPATVKRATTKDADHNGTSERWKTQGRFTLHAGQSIDPDSEPVRLELSENGQVLYAPTSRPARSARRRRSARSSGSSRTRTRRCRRRSAGRPERSSARS